MRKGINQMKKSEAKIGMKVHPLGRGDRVLYINEIGAETAGVSSIKGSKSNYGVNYDRLIKFKNQN